MIEPLRIFHFMGYDEEKSDQVIKITTYIMNQGKKIYVEAMGEEHLPTFLYLHGGPGAGCYDFLLTQGELLSQFIRIIAIDQRGVLRSDAITNEESFGLMDIIADCEAVRTHFNLQNWGLIGHSFGGYVAVKYKLVHPDRIHSIILECPTFDLVDSSRSLLNAGSLLFEQDNRLMEAERCREVVALQNPYEVWRGSTEILQQLGHRRDELYVYGPDKHFFDQMISASPLSEEEWSRASVHQSKLISEGAILESLTDQLAQIDGPMLLIHGTSDLVTTDHQVNCFLQGGEKRTYITIEESGHFPRFEQKKKYAMEIQQFIVSLHELK